MKYRILAHFVVEARDDAHAADLAKKLQSLLKHPMVRMAIKDEGIPLADGDGRPVVYRPQRETV